MLELAIVGFLAEGPLHGYELRRNVLSLTPSGRADLEQAASFFYDGDFPLRQRDMTDPYREGLFVIAKATSSAERRWLKQMLDQP